MIPQLSWEYPEQQLIILPFPDDLAELRPAPPGLVEDSWPPTQLTYLGLYLKELGAKTVIVETHYVDRDYIHDHALFYARSLRNYSNACQRWHYFSNTITEQAWQAMFENASEDTRVRNEQELQRSYLGFTVMRPLPGSPVGRTVLRTYGPTTEAGHTRTFPTVRDYPVHLAGMHLSIRGLAFQQQDQGVSACATTALWSALQNVARAEELHVPTPAEITQAASRYILSSSVGRALPSEGLTIQQLCEATRGAGLHPLVLPSTSIEDDRAQISGYISSGFAPVLTIRPERGDVGHAVCGVGIKTGPVPPQTNPNLNYQDGAAALRAVYIHDDRLGPYAAAHIAPWTLEKGRIATGLTVDWPGQDVPAELSVLVAIIVPLPEKLRMPLRRLRDLGLALAQATGVLLKPHALPVILHCRFRQSTEYRRDAFGFGLTPQGLNQLTYKTVLSRYVGVIELTTTNGRLYDILFDATETRANPSAIAIVRHKELPPACEGNIAEFAKTFGARFIR